MTTASIRAELVEYVETTRHDPRYTDAGIAVALEELLDELVDAAHGEDAG